MLALVLAATLTAFGDSITEAHCASPVFCGASSAANGYPSIVATARSMTLNNQGYRGSQLIDAEQMDRIYSVTWPSPSSGGDQEYMMLTGFNDQHLWAAEGAKGRQTYREALGAAIGWLAVDHDSKILPSETTQSGTWNSAAHGGIYATANGASLTFSVTGSVIYVVSERQNTADGAFLLTVDDEPFGTFACFGNSGTNNDNGTRTYAPFLIRIAGLTPGSHTVKLTKTGGDNVYFVWAGAPTAGRPVWVGNCLRMPAAGYTARSTTNLNNTLYNRDIDMVVETLAGDGLPVALVDAAAAHDPLTQTHTDNTHPTDAGHAAIAAAFLSKMNYTRPTATHKRTSTVGP